MKHKLIYSLLLSLVVLLSFNLAQAQTVDFVTAATDICPGDVVDFDVTLNAAGVNSFTLPIAVSGAGAVSFTSALGAATGVVTVVNTVQFGYFGAALASGTVLGTISVTAGACGDPIDLAAGTLPPSGAPVFAGPGGVMVPVAVTAGGASIYNGAPVAGANPDENLVCAGSIVNKQINATTVCGPLAYNQTGGIGNTDPVTGLYNLGAQNGCDATTTITVDVSDACGTTTITFDVIFDEAPPTFDANPTVFSYHWRDGVQAAIANGAQDDGCAAPLQYAFANPPTLSNIIIDAANGDVTVDPACVDIAGSTHSVDIQVTDACTVVGGRQLSIDVTNTLPWITCPGSVDPWYSYMGDLVLPVVAGDPDSDPITVTILDAKLNGVSTAPLGPMSVNGAPPYDFHFDPEWLDEGDWEITMQVDDGCWQATCTFNINVIGKFFLCIDSTSVLPGHNATVTLNATNGVMVGGMDLVISYDPSGLRFLHAAPAGIVASWEYFTFRYSEQDNCGGGCPSGIIRLIGIANMPNGVDPGAVYHFDGPIATMTFGTTEDLSFIGQCFHMSWTWFDCGDNTLSSQTGDTLFVDQQASQECLIGYQNKGIWPEARINFCDGIICIIPPPDDRGDINLNNIANEIADAVLFANYFIYGPSVLGYPNDPWYDSRVLSTDINDDGTPLTVADLVYLIRIITGDANPYPESGEGKLAPFTNSAELDYTVGENLVVTTQSTVDVGAAAFTFRHVGFEVGVPVLNDAASHMTIKSSDNNGELRVLVFSMDNNRISTGAHNMFTIPLEGNGSIELIEAQVSDAYGNVMAVNTVAKAVPTAFELLQNYPNPFNASTNIRFALPVASDWTLNIYNVAGQVVKTTSGSSAAGFVSYNWNAETASGIYFYKVTAGTFEQTKKMVLMK